MSMFSDRLISLSSKANLSQKELARLAEVTESAISYYIRGERTPRSDVLTRLAVALNTTTDYLLGKSDNPATPDTRLGYLQRNLGKLDKNQLKRAETMLKAAFDSIFDDEE